MLIVVAAYEVLDGGAAEVGYLTAAIGAGGLLGAFGAVALGSVAATGIVQVTGMRLAFLTVGAILPILSVLSYRRLLELDATVPAAPQLALVEGVPMFAPLSLAAKERIASLLVHTAVHTGDVVIRAGDLGDRFYIVEAGALVVETSERQTVVETSERQTTVVPGGFSARSHCCATSRGPQPYGRRPRPGCTHYSGTRSSRR